MIDAERFKLLHGPYRSPRCRLGGWLVCAIRGRVPVRSISAGRIPWPQTRHGRSRPAFILCGDLARAVRRESALAICHWWGVTAQTVTVWRKELGIGPTTEGTSQLRSALAQEPAITAGRMKAVAKARDPERRAKIAAARRGKPRPRHVIEAVIRAHRGKPLPEETKRKIGEAHRRRGTRPPKAGRPWTAEEDRLLAELPDAEAARRTGRTLGAVAARRRFLRILRRKRRVQS